MLTIIESPYAGDIERNRLYLKRAIMDSIQRDEIPFASHGFYTQYLSDERPEERALGIKLGFHFWNFAHKIAFYTDYDISPGMMEALDKSIILNIPRDMRRIGTNNAPYKD